MLIALIYNLQQQLEMQTDRDSIPDVRPSSRCERGGADDGAGDVAGIVNTRRQ